MHSKILDIKNLETYNLFRDNSRKIIDYALINSLSEIKIKLKTAVSGKPDINILNHENRQIKTENITYIAENNEIIVKTRLKHNENCTVSINGEKAPVILNPEIGGILDAFFYSPDDDFGITFTENEIRFKLWSPPAAEVELLLFGKNQNPVKLQNRIFFKNTKPGIWQTKIPLEYENFFYQYKITAYGKTRIALDPYAKSMAVFDPSGEDITGKGAIINLNSGKANPPAFKPAYRNFNFIENETYIIAYELNVRDFTIQSGTVNENIAGTFKGFIEKIPYLKELGITHVQLMPVNKAFTQIETDRSYTGKSAKESKYNWGYDPHNFFTPEGRYSTNSHDPAVRIKELKELVQALHNAGIGIILDVVFNHVYDANVFENIAPGCYLRLKKDYAVSTHTGAGASLESRRRQMRKFIIDALKFWVKEYHIDGFRFDLMSFLDTETMRQIRAEVGKVYNPENPNELILQGEAWNFTDLCKDAFTKTGFISLNIGIFNDTFRDALAGNGHSQGFIHGNAYETSRLASAIISGVKTFDADCLPFNKDVFFDSYNSFAEQPADCLNFMSVHDGLTLWDKINLTVKNTDKKYRLKLMKFAYAILLTSQGKIILHGGDEILRSKPLADFDKEKHRALTSKFTDEEEGVKYFHENSYQSPDFTNMFRWDRLTGEYAEEANELLEYVKGLIKLRRHFKELRLNSANDINNRIDFIGNNCSQNIVNSFRSYKLTRLKIKFINGNPGETLYLTGEIHKNNANPPENPYILHFNDNGYAEINFSKKDILNFDLNKWDKSRNLNFKLVKTPGKWDFPFNYYTDFGHNSISPESIDKNFETTIDLSQKDFKNIKTETPAAENFIAYKIKSIKKDFIIIHNAGNRTLDLKYEPLLKYDKITVILDENNVSVNGIKNSEVIICDKKITVPQKSSAVIICE